LSSPVSKTPLANGTRSQYDDEAKADLTFVAAFRTNE